jgi:glutathione S-transferase
MEAFAAYYALRRDRGVSMAFHWEQIMSLQFYYHPLSSFCHKVLIALYENATPFTARILNTDDPATEEEFRRLWPTAQMPLLRELARNRTIPESAVIIEYLQSFYPGQVLLIPADPDLACDVRVWDRVFDLYVQSPLQKVVSDSFRPANAKDSVGVDDARRQLRKAYGVIEAALGARPWIVGETFTMADCAAAPALFYADTIEPIDPPLTTAYLNRLMARPSYARILKEAAPYFGMFPLDPKPSRSPREVRR